MELNFLKYSMRRIGYRRGFTLIELLVVMAIILILAGLLTTGAQSAKKQSRIAKAKAMIASLEMAIGMYNQDTGTFPASGSSPYQQGSGCLLVSQLTTSGSSPPAGWNGPYMQFDSNDISGGCIIDPWGNKYYYKATGDNHGVGLNHTNWVDIWSSGPPGGPAIQNW